MSDPRKPALLLLDDDTVLREVLQLRLGAAGHEVIAVASCAAAVASARSRHFAAMLIDRHIGAEDGIDALQRLRACDGTRDARAIAISADLDDAGHQQLLRAGFDATVQKPVAIAQLLAVIDAGADAAQALAPTARIIPPVLDDAAAFAIWGNTETVRQLRRMLIVELGDYRATLHECASMQQVERLRSVLHRMRSSAGFCGAVALTRFIDATDACDTPDWNDLLARYDATLALLSPALSEALAT